MKKLSKHIFSEKKTIIHYGARQVGKTILVEWLVQDYLKDTLFLNGDDPDVREMLTGVTYTRLKTIIGKYKIVVIDEAQRIPETGLLLKLIHDNFKSIQLIATGSSAFELAGKINKPLTGRKYEFFLHPLSFGEMVEHHRFIDENCLIEHRLIYGYYPDIAMNYGNEVKLLKSLALGYLYKDLLSLEQIHKPMLLEKILKALALQLGHEVSYNEIAQLVGSNKGTVMGNG